MSDGRQVLIIDDDNDLCFMLSEVFRSRNFAVTTVNSLYQAKKIIKKIAPKIVILDNTLPDGTGVEFIPYLNKELPSSKIFMITGDYENDVDEFAGITHFIHKPFTLNKFRSIIDRYMS